MPCGVIAAALSTCVWVSLHLVVVRRLPAHNRVASSFAGYLLALPLVTALVILLENWCPGESLALGLITGHIWHLVLFFQYVHVYYHVDRSTTLRILTEVTRQGGTASEEAIHARYNLQDMVIRRLAILEKNGYIRRVEGRWSNTVKGTRLALAMAICTRAFRSKPQSERI